MLVEESLSVLLSIEDYSDSCCVVADASVFEDLDIVLGVFGSVAVDPLQLHLHCRSHVLVFGRLLEPTRRLDLPQPRLHCPKLVSRPIFILLEEVVNLGLLSFVLRILLFLHLLYFIFLSLLGLL